MPRSQSTNETETIAEKTVFSSDSAAPAPCAANRTIYRPDIDGLRAFAVMGVVGYHAFPELFPGGFVGVDVFFVISGYLISRILLRRLELGTFSYGEFMASRIRRIIPALLLVLASTWMGGLLLLTEEEFSELGLQITAGALFSANFYFFSQSGYFDTTAEFKPLLHLWSLGIEEQFYIAYPIALLVVFKRFRKFLGTTLVATSFFSLTLCIIFTNQSPDAAYFLLPFRLWELLLGGILAYFASFWAQPTRFAGTALSIGGICMIGIAAFLAPQAGFPGYWAILPALGTAFLIYSGERSIANRFISSSKKIVFIGLISYPLYLWHWPIISFLHISFASSPPTGYLLAALAVSFSLAMMTYHLIERPIKQLDAESTYGRLLLLTALIAALGTATFYSDGLAFRSGIQQRATQDDFHRYGQSRFKPCEAQDLSENAPSWRGISRCRQSKGGLHYDVILLGDSHAEDLFYGIAEVLTTRNVVLATGYGIPVLENSNFSNIFRYLSQTEHSRKPTVVIVARWSAGDPKLAAQLTRTVEHLQRIGYDVSLTDDVPNFPFDPRGCNAKRLIALGPERCSTDSSQLRQRQHFISETMKTVATATGAGIIKTHDFFREENTYFMTKGGVIFFRDEQHLTVDGSLYVGQRLLETGQLEKLLDSRHADPKM